MNIDDVIECCFSCEEFFVFLDVAVLVKLNMKAALLSTSFDYSLIDEVEDCIFSYPLKYKAFKDLYFKEEVGTGELNSIDDFKKIRMIDDAAFYFIYDENLALIWIMALYDYSLILMEKDICQFLDSFYLDQFEDSLLEWPDNYVRRIKKVYSDYESTGLLLNANQ